MSSRPDYGELATPEEQAAARGIPLDEAILPPPEPGTATQAAPPPAPVEEAVPRRRLWDSLLTTLIIMLWSLSVFSSFADFAKLGDTTAGVFERQGWGEFSAFDIAGPIGLAMNVVQSLLLVITLYLTYRATKAGRITFWIPLVTGVVSLLIISVLWAIVWSSDPAFVNWLESQR